VDTGSIVLTVWFPAAPEPYVWWMPEDAERSLMSDPMLLGYRWKELNEDKEVQINLSTIAAYEVKELLSE
jgi:hypothetical protein